MSGGTNQPQTDVRRPVLPNGSWHDCPLVGRDVEFAFLRSALADPDLNGVVVSGAPGMGKTRLAREMLAVAESDGCATKWVLATRATSDVPLAALAPFLPADLPDEDANLGMFRVMAGALTAGTEPRLVVGVDDAHFLDPMGAAFILHLALTGTAFVIATVRSGEPAPDSVPALWKEGLAPVLELQSLSEEETGSMASTALGGELERSTCARLFEATQGNPLFLRELVRSGLETGTLAESGGTWRWVPGSAPGLRLIELVESRVRGLSPSERSTLELLAICEPVGLEFLIRLSSGEVVSGLERSGFIEIVRSAQRTEARLVHPLYGEALRAAMPAADGWAMRRMLAAEVEATGARRRGDALAVATWRRESGSGASADLLTRGAREANEAFDHHLAGELAEAALEAGGGLQAVLALGEAATRQGRFADAEAILSPWEGAAGGETEAARYLVERTQALYRGPARTAEACALLDRAQPLFATRSWRALVGALRAEVLIAAGAVQDALDLARPLAEDPELQNGIRLRAASSAGLALVIQGRTRRALSLVDVAPEAGPTGAEPVALQVSRVAALFLEGRLDEIESLMLPTYDLAAAEGDHSRHAVAAMVLGRAALVRGATEPARRWLTEAVGLLREADPDGHLMDALSMLAQAEALAGNVAAAVRARDEPRHVTRSAGVWQRDRHLADVWITAASGELSRAQQLAVEAAGAADRSTDEAVLLHEAVRVGYPAGEVLSRLEKITAGAESDWLPTLAHHAYALKQGDGRTLEEVGERFEGFGASLLAAEAAAKASAAYRKAGRRSAARRVAARSRSLVEDCREPSTPALEAAEPGPQLSPREREVVGLAARGLSNADIAGRLVVSVRTVESHLLRAFPKLGVSRREELGSWAGAEIQ